jgi:hypothetical protein
MLECFTTFEDICERNGRFIAEADVQPLKDAMEGALLCYNSLAADALRDNQLLYDLTPKAHLATHLAWDFAPQANPRHVHCYCDEDMVGKMKRLTSKCHGLTAGRMGVRRYMILVGVRWWKRLSQLRGLG